MTREAGFKRRVRARMARTGEAYSTARARLDRHAQAPGGREVLHVTNGDSVAGTLRGSGVAGTVLAWQDVLHDGPVPVAAAADLRRVRASHLADRGWGDAVEIAMQMQARDARLEDHSRHEYLLWFEADLYDQLQLIQVLDRLKHLGVEPARIGLVSVGEYRGIAHFGGLGELKAEQLAALARERQALSREALELASAAWSAFTAPDPARLAPMARTLSAELRYLGEAFARLLAEYPSRSDGLSLTQRRILIALVEGEKTAGRLFNDVWNAEPRPFLGDALCWALMEELADGHAPLLQIDDGALPFPRRRVRLAPAGRDVLLGHDDHAQLNGIDRWIGGVHLAGRAPAWRYDERLGMLLPG